MLISELVRALKPKGYKQQEIASNLDCLVQKGWVREVVEHRSFTTKRGTTQSAERRTYKISDSGIDRLEAASMYQREQVGSRSNITNIRGVTVLGDGNVVNTSFTDLSRVLNDFKQAVLQEAQIKDNDKLAIAADIDTLESQLQKPEPERTVVQKLWAGLEKLATIGTLAELVYTATQHIQPLLK